MTKRVKIGYKYAEDIFDFYWNASADGSGDPKHHRAFEALRRAMNKIDNEVENEVRKVFGLKKI